MISRWLHRLGLLAFGYAVFCACWWLAVGVQW